MCVQVDAISADWAARADLPQHVVQMVTNFPNGLHPMSQFSAAITAMQMESKFARAYAEGLNKSKYWEVRVLGIHLLSALSRLRCLCAVCVHVFPAAESYNVTSLKQLSRDWWLV